MTATKDAPFGWAPAVVLVSVNLLDGMETNLVAGVLPLLQDDWGFGDSLAGAIPAAATLSGLIVTLPGGYLADRHHRIRLLTLVVASWALLTVASALAVTFLIFFSVRVLLGAANHLDNPLTSSLISDFYATRARGRAYGMQAAARPLGSSIGIAVGGVLGGAAGWRAPFLVMVVPGLLVAWFVSRLREPERGGLDRAAPRAGPQGREHTTGPGDAEGAHRRGGFATDLRSLAGVRSLRAIYLGVTIAFAGFSGLAFWLPSWYDRTFDLSEGAAGVLTAALALVIVLGGSSIGGILGDRVVGRRPGGRVLLAGWGLLTGGVALVAAFVVPTLSLHVPALTIAGLLILASMPNFAAATADVLPGQRRGLGFAVFTFVITIGSGLGPLVIGGVSDATGSLTTGFVCAAALAVPGGLVLLRARRHVDADRARALATPTGHG